MGKRKDDDVMVFAQWDPTLETGDAQVDLEHKRLFLLASELNDPDSGTHDPDFICAAIEDIMEYAHSHFAHEEALMDQFAYPDASHHKELHKAFAVEAERLGQESLAGVCFSEAGLAEFMRRWLTEHIEHEDRRLVEHVHAAQRNGGVE